MHALSRRYSGQDSVALFGLIEERAKEVEATMRSIRGFVSYTLVRTADGFATFTMCEDKAGTDEGSARAREWISTNAGDLHAGNPDVTEGTVSLRWT